MSIRLLSGVNIAGSHCDVSRGEMFLPEELESLLVGQGKAVFVNAPPMLTGFVAHAAEHAEMAATTVAMIGDSLAAGLYYTWGVSVATPSGYPNGAGRVHFRGGDDGVTLSGTGTFTFSAESGLMSWAAPGDSAGNPMPCVLGFSRLESATPGMALHLYVLSIPAADASVSVVFSGIRTAHNSGNIAGKSSLANWVESEFANTLRVLRIACGGSLTSDCVALLPYYKATAPGLGYDVVVTGTNDITNGVGSASIIANVSSLVTSRISEGRKVVLVGIGARYQTGTTPIVAGYLTALLEANTAFATLADAHKGSMVYVDAYNLLTDPAYGDGRPAANMLADEVHWGAGAIAKIGPEVIRALRLLGAPTTPRFVADGALNWSDFSNTGWLYGSGGTVGANTTSVSGLPANVYSGATASASAAVELGNFSDHGRRLLTLTYSASGASQYSRIFSSSVALAALGLAVGDTFQFYADIEVVSCGSTDNIYAQCLLSGTAFGLELHAGNIVGRHRMYSPPVKIPAGTTGLQWYVYIASSATTSGVVNAGDFLVKKVG